MARPRTKAGLGPVVARRAWLLHASRPCVSRFDPDTSRLAAEAKAGRFGDRACSDSGRGKRSPRLRFWPKCETDRTDVAEIRVRTGAHIEGRARRFRRVVPLAALVRPSARS